ncbi:MAG: sodium:calcium antiporter [Pirellulales bacterium]
MAVLILEFLGSAAVIVVAGTFLTRYADAIGERTGMGRTVAGLVLLATATSLPELSVDCNLARLGNADLAMGDLLGSSLLNLFILAVLDLLHRGKTRMLSRTAAAHALSATMSVAVTAVCLIFLLTPFTGTFLGLGPGPVVLTFVYLLGLRLVYFDQQTAAAEAEHHAPLGTPHPLPPLGRSVGGYLACTVAILIVAPYLAHAAEGLAEATGLGGTFVGTTLVAFCTSLPELVTTTAALRAGAFDLAVGNIFGSNTFNMVILLPVDAFFDGSLLAAASQTHAVTAACTILVTSTVVLGLLYRPEKRYWFVEPDAALVIFLVLMSMGLVYYMR